MEFRNINDDTFNYKKYLSNNPLLTEASASREPINESTPGYDGRKFGEKLPTMEQIQSDYEAKLSEEEAIPGDTEEYGYWEEEEKNILRGVNILPRDESINELDASQLNDLYMGIGGIGGLVALAGGWSALKAKLEKRGSKGLEVLKSIARSAGKTTQQREGIDIVGETEESTIEKLAKKLGIPIEKLKSAIKQHKAKETYKIQRDALREKKALNENLLGVVGTPAINTMEPRPKEIYEFKFLNYLKELALKEEKDNLDVYGYQTKHFDICPGAQKVFSDILSGEYTDGVPSAKEQDMITKLAIIHDILFVKEKRAISSEEASEEEVKHAEKIASVVKRTAADLGIEGEMDYVDDHVDRIKDIAYNVPDTEWEDDVERAR